MTLTLGRGPLAARPAETNYRRPRRESTTVSPSNLSPEPAARWLDGFAACYWKPMDAWYDEDEEVQGHLRDPYHRVDVRATSQRVRVLAGERLVAETQRAMLLSETGLPNRYYVPRQHLQPGAALEPSPTRTVCPYKGQATYYSLEVADRRLDDAAFSYEEPLEAAQKAAGYVCFLHDGLTVEADGEVVA